MVKKGRHRRYEEARALKHTDDFLFESTEEACDECGAVPEDGSALQHKSWCYYNEKSDQDNGGDLFPS